MANETAPREQKRKKQENKNTAPNFFVAGIGASAGGLKALEEFFTSMPADSGIAYVVIVHLSPEHESNLPDILQRHTKMPIRQVNSAIKVLPNHIYIIPPAKHLIMEDGRIRPTEPQESRGKRLSIDLFFRTLAEAYKIHAIGIVLSGTGTDGTLGLRRIKEESGISLVQDPEEAEYDGMPRSAINEGLADFILPVAKIPEKLIALRQTTDKLQLRPPGVLRTSDNNLDAPLEILTLLRVRTGVDFSNYKRSTIMRRIARRMQVNELNQLTDYLRFIREHEDEVQSLQHDLLITVTNFFRDHDSFAVLEKEVVPKIFEEKKESDQVRVWVSACATGEEAYSLAILLREFARQLGQPPHIQIFATDIDDKSIQIAREGVYPETISADVSPERLKHYFTQEGQYYRVKKEIREMVLFASHNLLYDPPFSRLDLVSCRNLLIYLNRETQDRMLQLFHFAIRPRGFLFLGSAETADSLSALFEPASKKHRIFRRSSVYLALPHVPVMPATERYDVKTSEILTPVRKSALSSGELHQILVELFAPPSILINESHDVIHISEQAGHYLHLSGGEPSRNLLQLIHPDLRLDLRAAVFTTTQELRETETRPIPIKIDGASRMVKLRVRLARHAELTSVYFLVLFEESEEPAAPVKLQQPATSSALKESGGMDRLILHLEEELARTKGVLHATVEQYETSTEELKASNEELQAINEELRSATEELETSKEELQSLNEELQTVNSELNDKVSEVSRVNSDLKNLLAATNVGTIFLDSQLRIKRFTPRVVDLFNLLITDVDRPLAHLTTKLDYRELPRDAEEVLQTLTPIQREVRSADDRWYIVRLLPYRTIEDRIDGVVLTFVEITDRKHAEQAVISYEEHLGMLIESAQDYAIFSLDLDGKIISWNSGAEKIFGFTESEALGQSGAIIFTPEDRERGVPEEEIRMAQATGRAEDTRWHLRKDGSRFFASGAMNLLREDGNRVRGFVKITRDLTEQFRLQEEREEAKRRLETGMAQLENRIKERTGDLEIKVARHRSAEEQIKDLMRRVVSTQEIERQRISRDLHDQLGQPLTALRLTLASLKEQVQGNAEMTARVEQLQSLTKQIDRDVDFLAWELRPAALDEFGLPAMLENFVQDWAKHFNVETEFHSSGLTGFRLQEEAEINLYRIAQEALNNISKHAAASRVAVILERRGQDAVLIIEDNGKGFEPMEKTSLNDGLGLISMRERASLVGGTLEIESTPGHGTTIFARVPIQERKEE